MSKLTRYIVLGIAVCMLLAVGIYGVYSATQVQYTLSGSISYDAGEFEATFNFTHISGAENANEEPLSEGVSLLDNGSAAVSGAGSLTLNQTLYFTNSSPNAVNAIIIALNLEVHIADLSPAKPAQINLLGEMTLQLLLPETRQKAQQFTYDFHQQYKTCKTYLQLTQVHL